MSTQAPLVTSQGTAVQVGKLLGKGGEGSVFARQLFDNQVIKLYHPSHLPNEPKQAKLQAMVQYTNPKLLAYTAWPIDTVHKTSTGQIVGFIMPKIESYTPIHSLYSPLERRRVYPKVGWDFLLQAARNTAAAFATLHEQGHIIGDVNQGNVLVGRTSEVMLIDCDSFQIKVNHQWQLCPVGVAHFTPPELQAAPSFEFTPRTLHHDNFGLALLIFHLLLGGRHPFSGRPLREEVGLALETDIKEWRYAYAQDARLRGMAEPRGAIPLNVLPASTQQLFEQAFTEISLKQGRPSAYQWVQELDQLRNQLVCCPVSRQHSYLVHQDKCPWCHLEAKGIMTFGAATVSESPSALQPEQQRKLKQLLNTISGVPFYLPYISAPTTPLEPRPYIAPPKPLSHVIWFGSMILGIELLVWLFGTKALWAGISLVLVLSLIRWKMKPKITWDEQYHEREQVLQGAQAEFNQYLEKANQHKQLFEQAQQRAFNTVKHYQQALLRYQAQYKQIEQSESGRQRKAYLTSIRLENVIIPHVTLETKQALAQLGIKTAFDVNPPVVQSVLNPNSPAYAHFMQWYQTVTNEFKFDKTLLNEQYKNELQQQSHYLTSIETRIQQELAQLKTQSETSQRQLSSHELRAIEAKVHQAEADLAEVKRFQS